MTADVSKNAKVKYQHVQEICQPDKNRRAFRLMLLWPEDNQPSNSDQSFPSAKKNKISVPSDDLVKHQNIKIGYTGKTPAALILHL